MNNYSLSMSRKYLNAKTYFTFYRVYLGKIVPMFPHHMLETKICLLLNRSTCKNDELHKEKGKTPFSALIAIMLGEQIPC